MLMVVSNDKLLDARSSPEVRHSSHHLAAMDFATQDFGSTQDSRWRCGGATVDRRRLGTSSSVQEAIVPQGERSQAKSDKVARKTGRAAASTATRP